jgi:hypothetical protein
MAAFIERRLSFFIIFHLKNENIIFEKKNKQLTKDKTSPIELSKNNKKQKAMA